MDLTPPQTTAELEVRARALAGLSIGELAQHAGVKLPREPRHAKGWLGQLIETRLGATAGSRAEPDFQTIGVELKTLPLNRHGRPRESTYVCTVPLTSAGDLAWETSWVRRKLSRVLWVPVEADPAIALARRRLGFPLLWSPTPEQAEMLRRDWEELMDMVCLGRLEEISARHGMCLQIRPKAANSRALRAATGASGEQTLSLPRGFYLRTSFTARILEDAYVLPGAH
ncbi:MAG: DNA mismatch repair endonuclease MutH [Pseudomonadota bacterium]|nr:MAG: DNA mismatch repair endonuclease MutH [Pseudomonadota bacterium]